MSVSADREKKGRRLVGHRKDKKGGKQGLGETGQQACLHRQQFQIDVALIDSQSQIFRAVKHLLQRRDGGYRISEQFIQGHDRGAVNFTQNQAMLHHHVTPFPTNL